MKVFIIEHYMKEALITLLFFVGILGAFGWFLHTANKESEAERERVQKMSVEDYCQEKFGGQQIRLVPANCVKYFYPLSP